MEAKIDFREHISEMRTATLIAQAEFDKKHAESRAEMDAQRTKIETFIKQYTQSAKSQDYTAWLEGYVKNGGKISHYYDYSMPDNFRVLRPLFWRSSEKVFVPIGYGSYSFSLLVPEGFELWWTELGHNNLYIMQEFQHMGSHVPCYSDI